MKKLKKVLICAAACVTACSFAAFTACGGEETPSEGLSADVTVTEKMSKEELGTQLAKFENQSATSFILNGGIKMTGENSADITLATVSAKINLSDGNADVNLAAHPMLAGDDDNGHDYEYGPATQAEGDAESGEEGGDVEMMEMSVYLRDWIAFYPDLTETGDGDFNYFNLASAAGEGSNMVMGEIVPMLAGGFMQDNTMLLAFANTTDSIVVDETEHTITLDINKMAYGVCGQIKQIVNNLTEYTTVSGLLKCSAVKYYIETYLGDMTGAELLETVMEIIMGSGEAGGTAPMSAAAAEENPYAAIMPGEGEKAYDYIVRMLDSQDYATLMGMEKPIGKTKIVDMVGEDASQALNYIKGKVAMVDQMITETAITVPSDGGMSPAYAGISVSGLQLVYTFDEENVLQSVDLSGKIGAIMENTAIETELTLGVAFTAEAITQFENIGGYTVNVPDVGDSYKQQTVADVLKNASAQ